jgi:Flp pilus assembly protein CpaB
VARHYLPAGTPIHEPLRHFKLVRYAKGDEPPDAITRPDRLQGTVIARTLAADQPVKGKDLADGPATSASLIPPGMRAVALPIERGAEHAAAQRYVDIVLRDDKEGGTPAHADVLFGVKVLAVDAPGRLGIAAERPAIVTFLVSPEQAADLIKQHNKLGVRVRKPGMRP